jgi:hypothetical protein
MPQASPRAPAAPRAAPAPSQNAAQSAATTVIVPGRAGAPAIPIPLTTADVAVLRDRVQELAGQRSAVNSQRQSLARELRTARPGPDAAGLEAHIGQLDGRLLAIESDIADLGKALSAAPTGLSQTTTSTVPARNYGPLSSRQLTAISVLGILFVAAPLAFAMARIAMRRFSHPPAPQIPKDVSDRLERMEQGIEAVALEIERIGEGQRFVTQLMSDRARRAALPEGLPRT